MLCIGITTAHPWELINHYLLCFFTVVNSTNLIQQFSLLYPITVLVLLLTSQFHYQLLIRQFHILAIEYFTSILVWAEAIALRSLTSPRMNVHRGFNNLSTLSCNRYRLPSRPRIQTNIKAQLIQLECFSSITTAHLTVSAERKESSPFEVISR